MCLISDSDTATGLPIPSGRLRVCLTGGLSSHFRVAFLSFLLIIPIGLGLF